MRTVSVLLAKKGAQNNFVDANATVLEALNKMQCDNLSYVIVMQNNHYLGVLSERDYVRKVILVDKHSHTTLVKEIMTRDLPYVSSDDAVDHCLMLMNLYRTRYLPVFDEFKFKGVLTINDLLREAVNDHDLAAMAEETICNKWVGEGYEKGSIVY
ncbi:MAG: CBS domain-containing protein [Filimonas sp.]|nr:CBS domain-containing protein [Filimonas sp.]